MHAKRAIHAVCPVLLLTASIDTFAQAGPPPAATLTGISGCALEGNDVFVTIGQGPDVRRFKYPWDSSVDAVCNASGFAVGAPAKAVPSPASNSAAPAGAAPASPGQRRISRRTAAPCGGCAEAKNGRQGLQGEAADGNKLAPPVPIERLLLPERHPVGIQQFGYLAHRGRAAVHTTPRRPDDLQRGARAGRRRRAEANERRGHRPRTVAADPKPPQGATCARPW